MLATTMLSEVMCSNENGIALELRLDAVGSVGDCIHAEATFPWRQMLPGKQRQKKGAKGRFTPSRALGALPVAVSHSSILGLARRPLSLIMSLLLCYKF